MTLTLLDTNFIPIEIIDSFESFIWTDRYMGYGDFEWYTSMTDPLITPVKLDYYISNDESDRLMIIEGMEISTDLETGNHIKISGRSLESILDRRIVWSQTILTGNLQNGVKRLFDNAIISPSDADRKIEGFVFEESEDKQITDLTIDAQYLGETIYDIVKDICEDKHMGFRVYLNDEKNFVFKLYFGEDRSENQLNRTPVKFCYYFDNLIDSNYLESNETYKNVTLVEAEDENDSSKSIFTTVGSGSGLLRRELYTESGLSPKDEAGNKIPHAQYVKEIEQSGKEALNENKVTKTFEGEVETTRLFVYGKDFFIGDRVEMENEYGFKGVVRIDEFVMNWSSDGYTSYPNFTVVDEEDNNG